MKKTLIKRNYRRYIEKIADKMGKSAIYQKGWQLDRVITKKQRQYEEEKARTPIK
ncbi:hypothetical protein [Cytobacillus purgationiresistens]|uniref:Fur-regulated basic protein B n=1 Tax=Cytobacillus purgationiresistens TaxID=863449 RepID=A0ABU0AKT8_9BACI|nr:hypothetical protein [Cytobacillus purgationiresistens]MDQ0271862.1 hypothetical protein [Cytobacillus purgationiresistens]